MPKNNFQQLPLSQFKEVQYICGVCIYCYSRCTTLFIISSSATATSSNEMSPLEREGNVSLSFDFESSPQDSMASPNASATIKRQETATKGGIRVSLACLPVRSTTLLIRDSIANMEQCRSRHVKCGAEVPACSRCQQDDKPCFYAKSRRGMRDGANSRKKDSVQQGDDDLIPGRRYMHHDDMGFPIPSPSTEIYAGTPGSCSRSPETTVSTSRSTRRLIDLFYM